MKKIYENVIISMIILALICMAVLTILDLIGENRLALGQAQEIEAVDTGFPKVIETIKAAKDIITGDKPELDEKTKEAMKDLKPVYKVPQDVLDRMMKTQNQIILLQKDLQIINAKLEGLNLAKRDEFWLWLTSIGVTREELSYWNLNKGMATRN